MTSVASKRAQREASKYVISLCDLCTRSKPDVEDEDYAPSDVKSCPGVFCVGYQERIPRGQMSERPGWKHTCELFAPDIWRIRSVMARMALDNAKGLAALDELVKHG